MSLPTPPQVNNQIHHRPHKNKRIDAVEEYRRVYGEDPPKRARISIIGDSDSTRDATLGYVDYIRVSED